VVFDLKKDFPALEIVINGGVTSLEQSLELLQEVDGVMLGREVYQNPYLLGLVDNVLFGENRDVHEREEIIVRLLPYIEAQMKLGVRLNSVTRHILGLFHGGYGARLWRRHLSENAFKTNVSVKVVLDALKLTENKL